jgi:hypothetical protein
MCSYSAILKAINLLLTLATIRLLYYSNLTLILRGIIINTILCTCIHLFIHLLITISVRKESAFCHVNIR